MSKTVNFIYKLDGADIDSGVNVFELAPILLSLGELIKESNKTLNPDGRDIAVNVKPFQRGSFIVDIVLFAPNNYQEILDVINNNNVKDIKELLEWIGIVGGTTYTGGKSLFWLIKKLKGKPGTVEQVKPDEVRYTDENGNTYTVNTKVYQLFSNTKIQNYIYNSYGKPLENENIDNIECYIKDEPETKTIFEKDSLQSIRDYAIAEIPTLSLEEELTTSMEVFVSPKRGSFDADPRQWSFRLGSSNEQIITATIKDEEFLEKYKSNQIRLHFTDVLKVKLTQKVKKRDGIIDLGSGIYEVEKVLEYHPAKHVQQVQFNNLEKKPKSDTEEAR